MIDAHKSVAPVALLIKRAGKFVFHVLRWFAYEFLPVTLRTTVSSQVLNACRLLAFVTIVWLMMFQTRGLTLRGEWYAWALDALLAILIGNLVKECAIWVGARVVNSFGVDFHRQGFMLNGNSFSEVIRADGTWRRCEFSEHETVCEWIDTFGKSSRSVSGPRGDLRKAWRPGDMPP